MTETFALYIEGKPTKFKGLSREEANALADRIKDEMETSFQKLHYDILREQS